MTLVQCFDIESSFCLSNSDVGGDVCLVTSFIDRERPRDLFSWLLEYPRGSLSLSDLARMSFALNANEDGPLVQAQNMIV